MTRVLATVALLLAGVTALAAADAPPAAAARDSVLSSASAAAALASASTSAVAPGGSEPAAAGLEECRVRIENRAGGQIAASKDRGRTWTPIGTVVRPNLGFTAQTDDKGFTAADWAPAGAVAATAVNAIHVKVSQGERHAILFTVQPKDLFLKTAEEIKSYFSTPTSIFTDLPAGTLLFGPELSPRLGNPVWIRRAGGCARLPPGYTPAIGDVLEFPSFRPKRQLSEIHFDNRRKGRVRVSYSDGSSDVVGRVEKPVGATGRFGGTQYTGVGRVRANHPGVLCISTSPHGQVGGFQIVPAVHSQEKNLAYVWSGGIAAWMVLSPLSGAERSLEGTPPLFSGSIRPGTGSCEVRFHGGKWQPVPALAGLAPNGLAGVTEIRLRF